MLSHYGPVVVPSRIARFVLFFLSRLSLGGFGLFAVLVFVEAAAPALRASADVPTKAAPTHKAPPGRFGVYCKLVDVVDQPEALRNAMRDIKAAGVDFILPYAKLTSGKVLWESACAEPSLVEKPHFLARVVEAAHAAGLEVHPVFCVATEGGDERMNALLEKNPSWAYYFNGARRGYIDAGNPAARNYQVKLIAEMVARHAIDGVSLDYMRAPNRVGYTDSGREAMLRQQGVDLARLVTPAESREGLDSEGGVKAAANAIAGAARKHPAWPEWRTWQRTQLNGFMREIRAAVERAKPGIPISTYCWGAHTYTGSFETCQDWKTWIAEGLIDWINPSAYRYKDADFREAAALNRANVPHGVPFYLTIGVKTSHGALPDVAAVRHQIAMAKEAGAEGLIFFTWEAMRRFMPELGAVLREEKTVGWSGGTGAGSSPSRTAHAEEVLAAREKRLARLKAPDGWLTLVGLHWLKPGEATLGSAPDNAIVLACGPARWGSVSLDAATGLVRLTPAPGVGLLIDGRSASGDVVLVDDAAGKPSMVTVGGCSLQVLARGERRGLRVKDREASTLRHFKGLECFPIDSRWRIEGEWRPFPEPKTVRVASVAGTVNEERVPGAVVFVVEGRRQELWAMQEGPEAPLFIVFADATSGVETYGAARFLYADPPKDGRVVLDFNKAINPPCAFTPFATCPLPPGPNRLDVAVRAGEKAYAHE